MKKQFNTTIGFVILTMVLMSCAPVPTSVSKLTNTFTPTPLPTLTPTLTPLPTVTASPTETKEVRNLSEKLEIVNHDEHVYIFKEFNDLTLSYDLQTDKSKENYPVTLNVRGFPNAEKTMSWAISDALFRSWAANHNISPTDKEAYKGFMTRWAQWIESGGDPKNASDLMLRFRAYWDSEPNPRFGEVVPPSEILSIIYIEQSKIHNFDSPIGSFSNESYPLNYWIYVIDGRIILISEGRNRQLPDSAYGEVVSTAFVLNGLFNKKSFSSYNLKFNTSFDGDAKRILKNK